MQSLKFDELYKKLNQKQQEAVDSIEGPVMVIAGPGTGKTQILTLRIANILKQTDTKPENILALTFTEAGVHSMRSRLAEIIGTSAYQTYINTFHGFCNEIITNYPENFPAIIGSRNITEIEQIQIIESLVARLPLIHLRPFGDIHYYVSDIARSINTLKREGVSCEQFKKIVIQDHEAFHKIEDLYHTKGAWEGKMKGEYQKQMKNIMKNQEMAILYFAYQKELANENLYDYSDMIMEVLFAFSKNKDLLLMVQEQYQYVLIDEHQDTNNAQNKILELLCNFHENPNIFAVGDEKQAIYRFQGASMENFMYFQKLYPTAKLIMLEDNYRSHQTILDSAHTILPSRSPLVARTNYQKKPISLWKFSKPEIESYFIASSIKEKLEKNEDNETIAVLFRDNKDAHSIAEALEKMNIPFFIESDQNILDDKDIQKLVLLLNTVNEFGSQEYLIKALHIDFLNISPLDVYKLIIFSRQNNANLFDVLRSEHTYQSLDLESKQSIKNFSKLLGSWKTLSKNIPLSEFFEIFVRESGFLTYTLHGEGVSEKLSRLNKFFDEIRKISENKKKGGLENFIQYINAIENHHIAIKGGVSHASSHKVRLMTAHRSKGQEFDSVYIVNAFDGHWGNKKTISKIELPFEIFSLSGKKGNNEEKNSDERRLFYVALTRAKKEVDITYFTKNNQGKDLLACQFIQEIRPELITEHDSKKIEEEYDNAKDFKFLPKKSPSERIQDREFIQNLFLQQGFSVTALNNYIACPWKYFYTNLLRVPQSKSKHQAYGTAVHAALNDFFKNLKERELSRDFLIDAFKLHLGSETLNIQDTKEVIAKGERALAGYYNKYRDAWRTNVLNEFKINGIMLAPQIRLTGVIDKIEFLDSANNVNVVDYKTGNPKTRGEIEGTTQNSQGDIKRQLVFYNLLLNYHDNGRYKMASGEIDFVEPDKKGNYRKEQFYILPEEVVALENLIKNVSHEIINLTFWDKRCEDPKCEFCELRKIMTS